MLRATWAVRWASPCHKPFWRSVSNSISRLVEHIVPSDIGYQETIDAMTKAQGSNVSDAASQELAWVGQALQQQVDLPACVDAFRSPALSARSWFLWRSPSSRLIGAGEGTLNAVW